MQRHDLVIVGGGAAGLMAALFAARLGARPVLLEGSKKCGLKILVSGGGRCNVLPSESDLSDFFSSGSKNVLKRLFRTWPLEEVHRFFSEDLGIPLVVEPETGKVFPEAQKAAVIKDALESAVTAAGGEIQTNHRVEDMSRSTDGRFIVRSNSGDIFAKRVILATGGQSLPKTGSDGRGYGFARAFGHSSLERYPALVPLASDDEGLCALSGIALPVRWRAVVDGKVKEDRVRELLFTHKGFSGPSVLDSSHWAVRDGAEILVSWGARGEEEWNAELLEPTNLRVVQVLSRHFPRRLAELIMERAQLHRGQTLPQLRRADRERLVDLLTNFRLPVTGNLGYGVAEVTGGGVPLQEIQPSTLESRCAEGLYLCGEILDVIGRIGGFNFLWAWVTGRLAGESAARSLARG